MSVQTPPARARVAAPVRASPEAAAARPAVARSSLTSPRNAGAALENSGAASIAAALIHHWSHCFPPVPALELRIPPLALGLATAALMWLASAYLPGLNFKPPFHSIFAWVFGFSGFVICTLGVIEFNRAKTTVNPTKPQASSSLVTSGIYRFTRNPMYLGFLLILTGWAAAIPNVVAVLALLPFVLYLNQFQIKPEEKALMLIFGDQFRSYCSIVRRWI